MKKSIDNGGDEQLVITHEGRAITVQRSMRRLPASVDPSSDDDATSVADFLAQVFHGLLPNRIG